MKLSLLCGDTKMTMRQEYFKNIGVTKAGPLAILLKDITSLYTEAIFYNHSAYYGRLYIFYHKAGTLALLLKDITSLCTEAIF